MTGESTIEEENFPRSSYKVYEQDLTEIHQSLRGKMKVSFLIDKLGNLVLKNDNAYWLTSGFKNSLIKVSANKSKDVYFSDTNSTCCDGILICGEPLNKGIDGPGFLGGWRNPIKVGKESFILDIRNNIKPKLSPSRIEVDRNLSKDMSWIRIQDMMDEAQERLWIKVFVDVKTKSELINFVKIASIYEFQFDRLPAELLWDKMYIPIRSVGKNKKSIWIKLSALDKFMIKKETYIEITKGYRHSIFRSRYRKNKERVEIRLYKDENCMIKLDKSFDEYQDYNESKDIESIFKNLIIRMSALEINEESNLFLHILDPNKLSKPLERIIYGDEYNKIHYIQYYGIAKEFFSIEAPFRNINADHPLASYIQQNKYNNNDLKDFAISLMEFVQSNYNFKDIGEKVTKNIKRLGCKYTLVNWDEYPHIVKPQYKIWTKKYGVITLTHDMFVKWANTKNEDLIK